MPFDGHHFNLAEEKKTVLVSSPNDSVGLFLSKMWLNCYRALKFSKFCHKKVSPLPQPSLSVAFFHAYRRLNLFLMFLGVCPFLQCKRSNRFICHPKYIQTISVITVIYSVFVIYLNSNEVSKLFRTEPNIYNILKAFQFFANSYLIFLLMIAMLRKRQSHADYFNHLYQFDSIYDKFIEPSIKYKHINRLFWIEVLALGVYILGKAYLQFATEVYLFDSDSVVFRINTYSEQFVYAVILFYMKNCAHNLIVRFRKVNSLLYKFLTNIKQRNAIAYASCQLEKLEKIAFMLNILLKAHQHLQIAFGSAFVLIFTSNLFAMAFNSYQIFNTSSGGGSGGDGDGDAGDDDDSDDNNDQSSYYIGAIFFVLTVPSICIFFYSMLRYHVLGNLVSNLIYMYVGWLVGLKMSL